MKRCISCGKMVREFAEILCGDCGKSIVRCTHCREIKNSYECECGFCGP